MTYKPVNTVKLLKAWREHFVRNMKRTIPGFIDKDEEAVMNGGIRQDSLRMSVIVQDEWQVLGMDVYVGKSLAVPTLWCIYANRSFVRDACIFEHWLISEVSITKDMATNIIIEQLKGKIQ